MVITLGGWRCGETVVSGLHVTISPKNLTNREAGWHNRGRRS